MKTMQKNFKAKLHGQQHEEKSIESKDVENTKTHSDLSMTVDAEYEMKAKKSWDKEGGEEIDGLEKLFEALQNFVESKESDQKRVCCDWVLDSRHTRMPLQPIPEEGDFEDDVFITI